MQVPPRRLRSRGSLGGRERESKPRGIAFSLSPNPELQTLASRATMAPTLTVEIIATT